MPFTRKQGYPQYKVDKTGKTVVDVRYAPWSECLDENPFIGSPFDGDLGYVLDSFSKKPWPCGTMGDVEYIYAPEGSESKGVDNDRPEYSAQGSTFEKPLEQHPSYLTKWNYNLAKRSDAAPGDNYANYDTDTTPVTNDEYFMWVKGASELPAEDSDGLKWALVAGKSKTKPGVESYFFPSIQVSERLYYSTELKASSALTKVAKRGTPGRTYGLTGGEWLNMGANINKDGRKWVVETVYQFSPNNADSEGWDHDIYAAVT